MPKPTFAITGAVVEFFTVVTIFFTNSGSSPTSKPTFATCGQDKFSSNAVTLQFLNSLIIISKSLGIEPTKLTIIGTS